MVKLTNLNIFFRKFYKQKIINSLSIFGLSIGMAVAILIGAWAIQEFSYDHFHENGDRIYRVIWHSSINDRKQTTGNIVRPLGPEAKARMPEIEKMCRIVNLEDNKIEVNHQYYTQYKIIMTDENFFDFFTFPLKIGDKNQVLNSLNGIVIDESTAAFLFPGKNAIGEIIRYDGKEWEINGIMHDVRANSHIQANLIIPSYGEWKNHHWNGYFYYATYFLVQKNTNIKKLNQQLNHLLAENSTFFKEMRAQCSLELLKNIHFGTEVEGKINSKIWAIALIAAAFIILLISCINFASLFISIAFGRARSIGIRKTYGAYRKSLILDFYKETYYHILMAIIIAIMLGVCLTPTFNKLLETQLPIHWGNVQLYIYVFLLSLITTLLAGTFPAFYMTRFKVAETLSSQFKGKKLSILQKGLLVIQFSMALTCLLIVFFIHKQVNMMITMNLEGGKEHVIYAELQHELMPAYNTLREELMRQPAIIDITLKNSLPQHQNMAWQIKRSDDPYLMEYYTEVCFAKKNYFDFMQMKLIAGENILDMDFNSRNRCVINEAAVRKLNLKEPIGAHLIAHGQEYIVGGVVKDAYTKVLYEPITPQVYLSMNPEASYGYILIKVQGNPRNTMKTMQKIWEDRIPEITFNYGFLDDAYALLYSKEIRLSEIFSWLMALNLLISLSGLFNMSYYGVGKRLREVGVRKINGASNFKLLCLLNRNFIVWALLAMSIAFPVSWGFIFRWQQEFIVHTNLSWWIFVLTGILAILITLLTVSYQTLRVSRVNPVDILKNE